VEPTSVEETENVLVHSSAHQFEDGEHIFWSSKFENNELIFTVELAPEWMTYSQYNQNVMGPLPTLFSFENNDAYELIGSVEESMVKMKHDKEANEELAYFEKIGVFTQKIKINSGEKFVVKGNINFMTCNQHGCEPPKDYSFEIEIVP
jgi:thiol:disulfide interchange protein DsbD